MAKEKRNHVQTASLFGLTVWYRIEMRKGYETIILSYRTDEGKIISEAQPVRVKNWSKRLNELGMNEQESELRLEKLIDPDKKTDEEKAIVNFCKGIVGIDNYSKVGSGSRGKEETDYLKMRRKIRGDETIPLGVILLADRETYMSSSNVGKKKLSETTVSDRKNAIMTLMEHEGSTVWIEATPHVCSKWFSKLSEHMQRAVIRLMQNVFAVQKMINPDLNDPWEKQTHQKNKNKKSQPALVKKQIEINSLTDGQCGEIIRGCIENCRSGKANLTEFAVLLLMTVLISVNELCALNYSDFSYLRDYRKRLVMRIDNESFRPKGSKYYKQRRFENQYQMRFVPLAHVVAEYFEALKSKAEITLSNAEDDEIPLFYGSKKTLHMRPNDLEKSIKEYMRPWMPKQLSTTENIHLITAVKLLQNTAEQHMYASGYEEEEIRRMKGAAPQLTSAKHYQDFANEAEQNKLGSMTDLWLSNAYPYLPEITLSKRKTGKEKQLLPDEHGGKTHAVILIKMSPIDPSRFAKQRTAFRVSALHGYTGTFTYLVNENLEES